MKSKQEFKFPTARKTKTTKSLPQEGKGMNYQEYAGGGESGIRGWDVEVSI